MDNICTQDYYHINRIGPWSPHACLSVGDKVDVGGSSNPFFRDFETKRKEFKVARSDGSTVRIPGIRFLQAVINGQIPEPTTHNLAVAAHDLAHHLQNQLRELIFEDVRKEEFPHLPSRQRCVWLISTQNGVRYWLAALQINQNFQVLRVRVQGRLHEASSFHISGDNEPMEETTKKARLYWSEVAENKDMAEVLFEGCMRVEEVMLASFYA